MTKRLHPYKEHMSEAITQLIYIEECLFDNTLKIKVGMIIDIMVGLQVEDVDESKFNNSIKRPNLTLDI